MIARRYLMLPMAAALTAIAVGALSSQTSFAQTQPPRGAFLTPLPSPAVVPQTSPFCRALPGRRCPPILTYGREAGGAPPTLEPVIKADLPHVRVSFVVQEIFHQVIANGGVNTGPTVTWETDGSAASIELGGPYDLWLPAPNGTDNEHAWLIYDALVFDACESFPTFPVVHDATIEQNGASLGAFHGVDNTTLDHTGYYNFNYTVRATGMNGRVSDFHFSGRVNVTCSGLVTLP
jgi:hypothetical protein